MESVEKIQQIRSFHLSGEQYFVALLKEAYSVGMVSDKELEAVQLQGMELLKMQCERYTMGESSSVLLEVAENIMESNLFTIGLYLKTLPDADTAVAQIKTKRLALLYANGRRIFDIKLQMCKQLYRMLQKSKLDNPNYSYNATLGKGGLDLYFKSHNAEFAAHEMPASIDYRLCKPVADLTGIEFLQKYMENLLCENQFCAYFDERTIHALLLGYDDHYEDLLINIFEQVLTTALGCILLKKDPFTLDIGDIELQKLYSELNISKNELAEHLEIACNTLLGELHGSKPSMQRYVCQSLQKIAAFISNGVKTNTLQLVFPTLKNLEHIPNIAFSNHEKMGDGEYRRVVEALHSDISSGEKVDVIKAKIHTLGDLEDILFDGGLSEDEMNMVFAMLSEVELAAIIKMHSFQTDIVAEEFSDAECDLRRNLQNYFMKLPENARRKILQISSYLVDMK